MLKNCSRTKFEVQLVKLVVKNVRIFFFENWTARLDVIALYTFCFALLARCDECRRLLRTGGTAARMRRLRAVLHQRGHGVRSARFGRALHPVQVHQDARTEGSLNLLPMNAVKTHIPITSATFHFSFCKFIMSVIFQTIVTSGETSRRFVNCYLSASSGEIIYDITVARRVLPHQLTQFQKTSGVKF